MSTSTILDIQPLGFPWNPPDPFLFCVHHDDRYPAGNDKLGPDPALLRGRNIGMDFEGKDGWRMYHGDVVPGFPQHPHRGFETITMVRKGRIDHSDSLGATARFGGGDVQWMTAGKGIVHSEMFPLLHERDGNHVELFQIWLNLPRADKMVDPYFSMLWADTIPQVTVTDDAGQKSVVTVVAGRFGDKSAPKPPPNSWAARPEADIAIWTLALDPGARLTLPAAQAETLRTLFFFEGDGLYVGETSIDGPHGIAVQADRPVTLTAGPSPTQILMLQGRPIGEPVVQHGPFVMNTVDEIRQAYTDYQRTRFGGWPWPSHGPVHARTKGRFAKHADGRVEERKA